MEKDASIIKEFLWKRNKEQQISKIPLRGDKYYEQFMTPFYKRVHTFR